MTKITNLNEILSDWAYRVDGGMPDATKLSHLIILEKTLIECGWNVAERYEFIKNLQEAKSKPDPEREKLMKKVFKYKDKEGNDAEITVGGAIRKGEKHPAYKKAKEILGDDEKEKSGPNIFDDPDDAERKLGDEKPKDKPKEDPNVEKDFEQKNKPDELGGGIEDKIDHPGKRGSTDPKTTIENIKVQIKNTNDQLDDYMNDPELKKYHKDYAKVKQLLNKIASGQKLTEKEAKFFSKYVRLVEPPEGSPNQSKLYVARVPGRFTRQSKPKAEPVYVKAKGHTSENTKIWNSILTGSGVMEIPTSTYGMKKTTANSTFRNEEGKTKLLGKEESQGSPTSADGKVKGTLPEKPVSRVLKKDGKITGIQVGNQKVELIDTTNLKGREKKEAESSNRNMIAMAESIENGTMDFIDMDDGVVPDSPENRVIVIQGAISGMVNRIRQLNEQYGNIGNLEPDEEGNLSPGGQIVKDLEDLAKRDPNEDPEQWLADFKSIMSRFSNHNLKTSASSEKTDAPSLSESWANFAEIYDCIIDMQGNGRGTEFGGCALLPESTTLETVDVISLSSRGEGTHKYVTLEGRSVKKGVGGASALTAKCEKTVYNPVGNLTSEQVKERVVAISKKHDSIYSKSLEQELGVHEKLAEDNKNDIEKAALEVGVSQEFIDELNNNLSAPESEDRDKHGYQPGGGDLYQKVMSALYGGNYPKKPPPGGIFKKRKNEGLPTDPATMKKLELRLISYYRYGVISHQSYNQNVDVQDFRNNSIKSQTKGLAEQGEIETDSSDGIDVIAYPSFEFNVGFTSDGRSSNPGAGRFKNKPKKS